MIVSLQKNRAARLPLPKYNSIYIGLLSLLLFSPVNAQIAGTAIGINPISKLFCENKTTGQQIELKNPSATSWDCEKMGLVATPGDIIKQTFKGTVSDPANIGGSIKGITAIKKLQCDNTSAQQAININPPTPDWNCASTGLIINIGDIVKQTLIGSLDQVAAIMPMPPTSFTATGGDGSIILSWTPSIGTDTTRIYSNAGPLFDPTNATLLYEAINTLPQSFTNSGLANGSTYYYYATSVNAFGEGVATATISATPTPPMFNHASVAGQICASCHNGVNAIGLSANHITTNNAACDDCHSVVAWIPATMNHAGITGLCFDCHNGVKATGKPATHINTSNSCDACHTSVSSFLIWTVDHNAVIGTCSSCHNGIKALGKPANHIVTTRECASCHSTTAWLPAMVDHTTVVGTCSGCHLQILPATHLTTTDVCEACHNTPPSLWINVILPLDHAQVMGSCESCHNGLSATGKPAFHIPTTSTCSLCHNVGAWIPAI